MTNELEKYVSMTEEVTLPTCSNPRCNQPGTKQCSACKTTPYCGPICQTAHWTQHKEECPGHLRKVGMAHLQKAIGFDRQQNWVQTLRHAELALTKLLQHKDRRLETVEILDDAFTAKFDALQNMNRHREALECIKENYTLWAMNHIRNPRMFNAVFALIQSCIHNEEFEDASLYAHTAHEMVLNDADGIIPSEQREWLLAEGCHWLSAATLQLAQAGGIPPEEKQKAGEKAIAAARQALEICTRLHGTGSVKIAHYMRALANVVNHFNNVDDDEVLRLNEQSTAIIIRLEGATCVNVAVSEHSCGSTYLSRAERARAANDVDRYVINMELASRHYRESARIDRVNNNIDSADDTLRKVVEVEKALRKIGLDRETATATTRK